MIRAIKVSFVLLIKVTLGHLPGAAAGCQEDQFVMERLELLVKEGRRAAG